MLTLPCTPRELLEEAIIPALALLPGMDSRPARGMLVAISKQESDLRWTRQQLGGGRLGPACGPWQFERIGVLGVTQNHKVDDLAAMACREAKIACTADLIMRRIQVDFVLAARIARLNLWTDKAALPAMTPENEEVAFQYYRRVWRPGAAKDPGSERYADARKRWHQSWRIAMEAVND